jgi:hypothetical protein
MELGDSPAVFKKERAVCQNSKQVGFRCILLLLIVHSRFCPPSAQEAAAERLHFDPAHHGTDGEQYV